MTKGKWKFGQEDHTSVGYDLEVLDGKGETVASVFCYEGDRKNANAVRVAPEAMRACQLFAKVIEAYGSSTIGDIFEYSEDFRKFRSLVEFVCKETKKKGAK